MSPPGCQKMSATPCHRNAEERFPVLSLKSREQEPPNPLLIRDKAFYSLGRAPRGPGPGSAPWRHVVRDRARGQEILRPQVPWTPAPVPRAKRGEDVPHVALTRVPAAWTQRGRWHQRCPESPLVIRESRGISRASLGWLPHKSARLCC